MQDKHQKVQTLLDAIPYIKKFNSKTIVIKYGGSAQTSPELQEKFAQDIVLLSHLESTLLLFMVEVLEFLNY